jgi:C4-dicarboxylate transporter DctM subunit
MGGFIPGAIAIAGLMITSYLICRKRSYDPPQPFSMARLVMETRKGIWAIIMPPFIIGGIVVGIFTPTEAAAAAVAYSLFCGLVIYRQLTFRAIVDAGVSAGRITALTLVIFAFCQVFTWVLMAHNIPQAVTQLLLRISNNPYVILFVLNVLMLIMGCFLDPLSGILIVVPMVMETIQILNISPIHFGVMMVFNLCIGNLTPPVGFALYVAQDLAKLTLEETIKSVMPFLCVLIGVLLIITYIPASITWLPQLAGM